MDLLLGAISATRQVPPSSRDLEGPVVCSMPVALGAINRRGCGPLGRGEPTETAQRTETLDDDIDGGPADDPIPFSYHGTQYEIVQCKEDEKLVEAFWPSPAEQAGSAAAADLRPRRPSGRGTRTSFRLCATGHAPTDASTKGLARLLRRGPSLLVQRPSWTLGGNRLNDDIAAADQNVAVGAHLDVAEQDPAGGRGRVGHDGAGYGPR